MPRKLSGEIQAEVRLSAGYLCEYCHTDERWQLVQFTFDHIVPRSQGGPDDLENLALACFHCNRKKSDKQAFIDPRTQKVVKIFNPRTMHWADHFSWSGDSLFIVSETAIGKITIELLRLNRERILQIRQDDKLVGRHPPRGQEIDNRF